MANVIFFNIILENRIRKYKKIKVNTYLEFLDTIKIELGEKNRTCPFCNFQLSSLLNYKNHVNNRICRREQINTCKICNKSFSRKSNYYYHISNNVCEKKINLIQGQEKQKKIQDQVEQIQDQVLKVNYNSLEEYKKLIRDQIYLEEYRKLIRKIIQEELTNKKIDEVEDKPVISKYKKVKISNIFKRQCWNHWIGEDIGKILCPVCKLTHITQLNFSCAHILPESKGGRLEVDNVRPVCGNCNSSVYTKKLTDFL